MGDDLLDMAPGLLEGHVLVALTWKQQRE